MHIKSGFTDDKSRAFVETKDAASKKQNHLEVLQQNILQLVNTKKKCGFIVGLKQQVQYLLLVVCFQFSN